MNHLSPHFSQGSASYCNMTYQINHQQQLQPALRATPDQQQQQPQHLQIHHHHHQNNPINPRLSNNASAPPPAIIDNCNGHLAYHHHQPEKQQQQIYETYSQPQHIAPHHQPTPSLPPSGSLQPSQHHHHHYNLYMQPSSQLSDNRVLHQMPNGAGQTIAYQTTPQNSYSPQMDSYAMQPQQQPQPIERVETMSNQYISISTRSIPQAHHPDYAYDGSLASDTVQDNFCQNYGNSTTRALTSDSANGYLDEATSLGQSRLYYTTTGGDQAMTGVQPNGTTINGMQTAMMRHHPASGLEQVDPNGVQSLGMHDISATSSLGLSPYDSQIYAQLAQTPVAVDVDGSLMSAQRVPQQQQLISPLARAPSESSSSDCIKSSSPASYMSSVHHGATNVAACNASQLQAGGKQQEFLDMRSCGNLSQDWLDTICRHLIEHMNHFGICVIDNFLGALKGESILKEVQQLYSSGQYTKGRLVNNKLNSKNPRDETGSIRSDRVIWIDGCEEGCAEINNLIQTLCSVITNSSRLSLYSNNGLDKIVINKRTKAHVACYPGNGTRYIKHVDNPNGDGRVITAIYYLNKNWNTKRDGGLLRMFPAGMDEVANIEPLFDRVLFFWSDRRNPHEVLPAYKDRFAITVWYIGESRQ